MRDRTSISPFEDARPIASSVLSGTSSRNSSTQSTSSTSTAGIRLHHTLSVKGSWFKLLEDVVSEIEHEVGLIDQLFETFAELLERARRTEPNVVEMAAIATVLHSFYNGLENIFLRIAKGIDHELPSGEGSHRALLNQMVKDGERRNTVITTDLAEQLREYLGFRHFLRHSYSFLLQWEKLEELLTPLPSLWNRIKKELDEFVKSLDESRGESKPRDPREGPRKRPTGSRP